jgi:hypothetical protein
MECSPEERRTLLSLADEVFREQAERRCPRCELDGVLGGVAEEWWSAVVKTGAVGVATFGRLESDAVLELVDAFSQSLSGARDVLGLSIVCGVLERAIDRAESGRGWWASLTLAGEVRA